MIPLIDKNDNLVLAKTDGMKNAVYYLDLIAFYDAYSSFVDFGIDNLPNYCVIDNKLYLDGICLLIKDYSAKFGFATLDLTLDYLKYLYYSIAKFSKDGFLPDREIFTLEFELRKNAGNDVLKKLTISLEEAKKNYDSSNFELESSNEKTNNNLIKIKNINLLMVMIALLGIAGIGLCVLLKINNSLSLINSILIVLIVFIILIFFMTLLHKKKKKIKFDNDELHEKLEKIKLSCNEKLKIFNLLLEKNDKITIDVHSYVDCFNALNALKSEITIEFLNRATDFNIISSNIKNDIISNFESHSNEINDVVKKINSFNEKSGDELENNLCQIYEEIMKKDYLNFNNYVRYSFINKFISYEELSHNWRLKYNEKFVYPFDIDIKGIVREEIAFLENKFSHFIKIPVDKILHTKLVKDDKKLKIPTEANLDLIRTCRLKYLEKFYNLNELEGFDDMFMSFDENKKSIPIDLKLIEGKNKIPTLINMKIKLIEANTNSENSYNKFLTETLPQLIEAQNEKLMKNKETDNLYDILESFDLSDYVKIDPNSIENEDYSFNESEVENIEEIDEYKVKYTIDGEDIIGYKI